MKTYEEIKTEIAKLGIKDMPTYKAYIDEYHRDIDPKKHTPDEVEALSPDNVDNAAFWRLSEEIFGTDPVCNAEYGNTYSKMEGNRNNLFLFESGGGLAFIKRLFSNWRGDVLEIGPGYGSFKNWVELNTVMTYYGVDVYPKIDGVDQALPNGLMGPETLARRYGLVVSTNVFQHLSVNQRRAYYRDVASILQPNGYFIMNNIHSDRTNEKYRHEDGKFYMRHYGQLTEIQKSQEIIDDVQAHMNVLRWTKDSSGMVTIIAQKR